jgi:acyl-CoA thioester hydrolase
MGVAHHSVYPVWFEAGRTDFIRERGTPYGKLESEGLYLPLIEMSCRYSGFSRYEDVLTIMTRVSSATKSRLHFFYEVLKEGTPIASGMTAHVYANRQLRPVNLEKYRPELYRLFLGFAGIENNA